MTVAVDKRTGRVIGQVVLNYPNADAPLLQAGGPVRVLGRDGRYFNVSRYAVRLERIPTEDK